MTFISEIATAITAHGRWKARLAGAIETGALALRPEEVRSDRECEFGKWLYGRSIAVDERDSPHYDACRQRHAAFHAIASEVVELAVAGRKDEATREMEAGGRYAQASAALVTCLMQWMNSEGWRFARRFRCRAPTAGKC